ncbi:MAG: hydrogenase small subunit [Bacteroidales bacterium]
MKKEKKTVYEELMDKGYSRRQFLKFCGLMGGMLGLQGSGVAQIVEAFETKPRVPVLWYHFQECTCCSESFIRASHPVIEEILFDLIALEYDDTLMAAAGKQAEELRTEAIKNNFGEYILLVEGAVPLGNSGFCTLAGQSAKQVFDEGVKGAKAIIAWGNCASSGCIQAAHPNPTQATPVHKLNPGKPVINVQGCPPIADVMAGIITYYTTFGKIPELDNQGRPKVFYGRRIHDTCYRRPCYDAGLFVESWDDENAKHGYCLYKMGCKGPNTYNSCAIIKWNNNVSYPIQSGHGCIGCAEAGFWDREPMYEPLQSITGIGIEATATQIGIGLGAVALGGVAVHAAVTNFRKHSLIKNRTNDISLNVEENQEIQSDLHQRIDKLEKKIDTLRKDQLTYIGDNKPDSDQNKPN